jgi:hypothetical protein
MANELRLTYKDGRTRTPFTISPEFHTKYFEFDGVKFEKQKDGSYLEVGEAKHTTLVGSKGAAKSKLSNKGGK